MENRNLMTEDHCVVVAREHDKKYISEKEVSEITGRAVQTLRNDRFNGRGFPYIVLFGKSIRYDEEVVIDIMEKSKVETSSFRAESDAKN